MALRIVLVCGGLILVVLALAATRPNTFQIRRTVTIHAPAEGIFALINNFHTWPLWAPQDKEDPTFKRTFSGPVEGAGAVSDWIGTGNSGRGRMLIVQSVPPTQVSIQVDWVKPFQARNRNDFLLAPHDDSTTVTWAMQGPNLYPMKVMGLFVNMDPMMGKHFETGLSSLKALAEH